MLCWSLTYLAGIVHFLQVFIVLLRPIYSNTKEQARQSFVPCLWIVILFFIIIEINSRY